MAGNRPKWIHSYLSPDDLEKVERAVFEAEKHTSAELVPVVVRRSSTLGHVPIILLLFVFLVMLGFELPYLVNARLDSESLGWVVCLVVAILLGGGLSRWPFLQRVLTPKGDQAEQVNQRAELQFYRSKIKQTQGRTGILVFVSLLEHRVVVLADEAISKQHEPEIWDKVIDQMLAKIKSKNLAEGFVLGLQMCGDILKQDFPREQNDKNELKDQLVILEN